MSDADASPSAFTSKVFTNPRSGWMKPSSTGLTIDANRARMWRKPVPDRVNDVGAVPNNGASNRQSRPSEHIISSSTGHTFGAGGTRSSGYPLVPGTTSVHPPTRNNTFGLDDNCQDRIVLTSAPETVGDAQDSHRSSVQTLPRPLSTAESERSVRHTHTEQALALPLQRPTSEATPEDLRIRDLERATTMLNAHAKDTQESAAKLRSALASRDDIEPDQVSEMQKTRWKEKRHAVIDYQSKVASHHLESLSQGFSDDDDDGGEVLAPETRRHTNMETFFRVSSSRKPIIRQKRKYHKIQPSHTSRYSPPFTQTSFHRNSLRRSRRSLPSTLLRSRDAADSDSLSLPISPPIRTRAESNADLREQLMNALDAGKAMRNSIQRTFGLDLNRPSLVIATEDRSRNLESTWETPSPSTDRSPPSSVSPSSVYPDSDSDSRPSPERSRPYAHVTPATALTTAPPWSPTMTKDELPWQELHALAEGESEHMDEGRAGDESSDDDLSWLERARILERESETATNTDVFPPEHQQRPVVSSAGGPSETSEIRRFAPKYGSAWTQLMTLPDESDTDDTDEKVPTESSTFNALSHLNQPLVSPQSPTNRGVATIYGSITLSRSKADILAEYNRQSVHLPEYAQNLIDGLDHIRDELRLNAIVEVPDEDERRAEDIVSPAYRIYHHPFAAAPPETDSTRLSMTTEMAQRSTSPVTSSVPRTSGETFTSTLPRTSYETAGTAFTSSHRSTHSRSSSYYYPKHNRFDSATPYSAPPTSQPHSVPDPPSHNLPHHRSHSDTSHSYPMIQHPTRANPASLFSIPESLSMSSPHASSLSNRLAVSEVPASTLRKNVSARRRDSQGSNNSGSTTATITLRSFWSRRSVLRKSGSSFFSKGRSAPQEPTPSQHKSSPKSDSPSQTRPIDPLGRQDTIGGRMKRHFSMRLKR